MVWSRAHECGEKPNTFKSIERTSIYNRKEILTVPVVLWISLRIVNVFKLLKWTESGAHFYIIESKINNFSIEFDKGSYYNMVSIILEVKKYY